MLIHDAYITGSLILNGVDIGDITGSEAEIGSLNQFSASINSYTASINSFTQSVNNTTASLSSSIGILSGSYLVSSASFDTRILTNSSSIGTLSSSFLGASSSFDTRILNNSSSIGTLSSSFLNASSSFDTRILNNSSSIGILSSSFLSTSSSLNSRVGTIESHYATTGSNTFTGTQYASATNNAVSFTSTASFYTDGGMRITKDMYVSGNAFFNNVTVFGTQSISYITSSQLNISTNIITVNTDTPAIRFGGLAVYDSGSTRLSGSMLWDSEKNNWVYSNPSGSSYDGGMIISGPRNSSGLGNEQGTTACALMMGQGQDHITSSAIMHYGNATCFYGNSYVSSSGAACFAGTISSNTVSTTDGTNTSTLANNYLRYNGGDFYVDACAVGGNFRIRTSNTTALDSTALFICGKNSNVGIGTTSPSTKLYVSGYTVSNWITTLNNTGTSGHQLYFGYNDGSITQYGLYIDGGPGSGTGNFDFGVGSSKFRVMADGKVGIGTSSPARILTVNSGNVSSRILLQNNCTGTTIGNGFDIVMTTDCIAQVWNYQTGPLQFATSNAQRVNIDSNGIACFACQVCTTQLISSDCSSTSYNSIILSNTCIGATSNKNVGILFRLRDTVGTFKCSALIETVNAASSGNVDWVGLRFMGYCNDYASEFMRINSCGNVGIGTASPSAKLEVSGAGYIVKATASGSDSSYFQAVNGSYDYAAGIATSLGYGLMGMNSNHPLVIMTNATERMKITSTGIACFACQVCASTSLTVSSLSNALNCIIVSRYSTDDNYRLLQNQYVCSGLVRHSFDLVNAGTLYACNLVLDRGNVGIGTGSPSTTLYLATTTETNIRLESGGAGGDQGSIYVQKSTGGGLTFAIENRDFIWRTGLAGLSGGGGSERMRITSAGIATFACQICTAGLQANGPVVLGGTGNAQDNPTRLAGTSVYNGVACYGSYGKLLFNANTNLTGGALRYLLTNALDGNKFGFIRSSDANTDPSLGLSGAISSGTATMVFDGGNVGIGASTAPVYMLEVSSTGGSQRIRVGTLQNNDNTPRFEAITSNGVSVANSAWLKVNDAGGFTLGQSDYTKAGGDSGNFSCLSSEVEVPRITVSSGGIMSQTQPLGKNFIVLKCRTINASTTGYINIDLGDYMSTTYHLNMDVTAGAYGNSGDGPGVFKLVYGGYFSTAGGGVCAVLANCITNGTWGWCTSGTGYCVALVNSGTQEKFVMVKFDVSYQS